MTNIVKEEENLQTNTTSITKSAIVVPTLQNPEPLKIDRFNVCPSLARIFIKINEPQKEENFKGPLPEREVQLHVWKDSTLREITDLLKEKESILREYGTKIQFNFVYPDKRGRYVMREVTTIDSMKIGKEDNKTLDELHYQIGDFLAISIWNEKNKEIYKEGKIENK